MLQVLADPIEGAKPKRSPGRPRKLPPGESAVLCAVQFPTALVAHLDRFRAERGWSRSLAIRHLLAESLNASVPDFAPSPFELPRRSVGRPKGFLRSSSDSSVGMTN